MDYRPRFAERKLKELVRHFKVVLVTGARQVCKSTMLAQALPDYSSFVFDPLVDLGSAREDPDLFLDNFRAPLVLDEVQYAPEVLPALKRRVDADERPGQYVLSGSQNIPLMRSVAESMAGRVGILHLEGMAPAEMAQRIDDDSWLETCLTAPERLQDRLRARPVGNASLAHTLWRGGLPGLLALPDSMVPEYLSSYVRTYLERDVRLQTDLRDVADFTRFLGLLAALTAQEINDSQLGREVGISPPTARRWRETLVHSYQWRELSPYQGDTIKRLSGKRKGHMTDVGLACHLQLVSSPAALAVSPYLGAFFETWVVNTFHREFVRLAVAPRAYHWRTSGGAEVDLVLERDGELTPIEVKAGTRLSGHDLRGLHAFRKTYPNTGPLGLIVYAGPEVYRPAADVLAVPFSVL